MAKFRGAGQGLRALVAEVIVGELARRLGLLVPELVVIAIDGRLGAAEPDPEIQELITASDGAQPRRRLPPRRAVVHARRMPGAPDPALAADVVWLDALATNVDRTPRNPNLLLWHERLWLIDHGAALYLQHGGLRSGRARRQAVPPDRRARAAARRGVDRRRRPPAAARGWPATRSRRWWAWCRPSGSPPAATSPPTYVEYLSRRLADGGFVEEAERARIGG